MAPRAPSERTPRGSARGVKKTAPSEPSDAQATSESAELPLVPEDAGIDPVLLALLHAAMFLDLSEQPALDASAARPVLERIGLYVQRLSDDDVEQLAESLSRLADRGERDGWPPSAVEFVRSFVENCGFTLESD